MKTTTKIDFRARSVSRITDITDLVGMLFPGNQNQQYAAAQILLLLKGKAEPVNSLSELEERYSISRRTLQRSRAKLTRLGLIDRVSWMNARFGGREGWLLSSRMSSGLRRLADAIDEWRKGSRPEQLRKDRQLVDLLQ
jgi:DNA-binding transcriptional ArsR family regulator